MFRKPKNLLILTTAVLLSGCGSLTGLIGRVYEEPKAPEMSESILQEQSDGRYQVAAPVAAWWEQLGDDQLTELVTEALANNLDVKVAVANVKAARAYVRGQKFDRYPTVTASGGYTRERLSNDGRTGKPADRTVSSYDAGFDAFWELDLFGRVEEGIAARKAVYEGSEAELANVYVTVAAEVARTYTELRGAQYRLSVAKRNAENQQKTYDLITNLVEGGRSSDLDIARAQAQLDQTLALVPPLEAEINAAANRLAVLTGKTPDALRGNLSDVKPIPSIPAHVLVGSAQDLLKNRPDVRVAERALATATAEYNVNVADFYPTLSVSGSLGFLARTASNLFTSGATTALLAPGISWSAFDLGRVKARVDASDAATDVAMANFQQTVLEALEELDSSMVRFSREEQRRARLLGAAESSAKAAKLARQRYEAGRDSFLDLLDTERRLLDAEDALASSETQAVLDLIAVYKALGGGWQGGKAAQRQ
ncbi:MAG: efflux transporter outer membrane subunit [Proteobacteria bacterium]|nr:efflux transporter outer membrane subunit [Pseudomonadota bacterium]